MKIIKIARDLKKTSVFVVTFKPNLFEKMIGRKLQDVKYKETDELYKNGWTKYVGEDGITSSKDRKISKAIDSWRANSQ